MKLPDGLPEDMKKLLASLDGKGLQDYVESTAKEAIGTAEVQAYLGSRISANFLNLVGSGIFQLSAIMTMAQAVSIQLVESVREGLEEHNQTCPKDHSNEIKAHKQLEADLEKAFTTCRDTLNKDNAHAEEHTEVETKSEFKEEFKIAEVAPAPKLEEALVKFDSLMKQAISKIRSKKPIKAEVDELVTLLDSYEGQVEIMRKAQSLIANKTKTDKSVAITKFVKSIA